MGRLISTCTAPPLVHVQHLRVAPRLNETLQRGAAEIEVRLEFIIAAAVNLAPNEDVTALLGVAAQYYVEF
jgi:hypothetical protein